MPIQVDIEETHGHSILSEGKVILMNKHMMTTQQTVEKFGALSILIEKDEGVATHLVKKRSCCSGHPHRKRKVSPMVRRMDKTS